MAQETLLDFTRTSVLDTQTGNVKINSRWANKRKQLLWRNWKNSEKIFRAFNALQVLQSFREAHVYANTLREPLDFLYASLPNMVKQQVNIYRPRKWSEDFDWNWTFDWDDDPDVYDYPNLEANMIHKFQQKPWHFWPLDVERSDMRPPRWALVVLYFFPDNELKSIAVLYPDPIYADSGRIEDNIATFIVKWLRNTGQFNFPVEEFPPDRDIDIDILRADPAFRHHIEQSLTPLAIVVNVGEIPGNPKYWSSGLRVFEMIRIFLERITQQMCMNAGRVIQPKYPAGRPTLFDEDAIWDDLPGWFNPDSVRTNMTGMAASMVNKRMRYQTRIAIEPIIPDTSFRRAPDSHLRYLRRMNDPNRPINARNWPDRFRYLRRRADTSMRPDMTHVFPFRPDQEEIYPEVVQLSGDEDSSDSSSNSSADDGDDSSAYDDDGRSEGSRQSSASEVTDDYPNNDYWSDVSDLQPDVDENNEYDLLSARPWNIRRLRGRRR
ncbi:hypothetical protein F5Y16DRAFT_397794 [Xylariaceae sp. FL0255]|nr:hypothetical protein F5Y16DRAFT_397794 [Xylariaceae sp. FL0255]